VNFRRTDLLLATILLAMPLGAAAKPIDRTELDRRVAAFEAIAPDADPAAYRTAGKAALDEALRLFPASHPEVAARRIDFALTFAAVGELDAAAREVDSALPILERARAVDRARWGQAWRDALAARAFILNFRSDHKASLALNEQIVDDYRASMGTRDDKGFATAINNLAAAKFENGALEEALALNAEATDIALALAKVPGDVAIWQANRVAYLYTSGRTEEAIAAARKGIARSSAALGEGHAQMASLYANLGAILYRTGRPRDALPIIRRAFELIETAAGQANQNSATMRLQYAQALTQARRYSDAVDFLGAAMAIIDAQLGVESDRALVARDTLGLALIRLGRASEAQVLAEKLVSIREARLPEGHRDRANAQDNLAKAALANRDFSTAQMAAQRAVDARVGRLPADHPDLLLARAMALRIAVQAGSDAKPALLAEARVLFTALTANANLDIGSAQANRQRPGYGWLAEVFARLGATEDAFAAQQWMARTSVDDTIALSQLADAASADKTLADRLVQRRALLAERQGLAARLDANMRKPDSAFNLAGTTSALTANRLSIEALDAGLSPAQATHLRFVPVTRAQAAASIDNAHAAVMFTALENDWLLTAFRGGKMGQWRLEGRGETDALVRRLRASLEGGGASPFDRAAAAQLHQRLFPTEVAAFLKGTREWAIAADGSLAALPFAVLVPDLRKADYLIDRVTIRRLAGAPRGVQALAKVEVTPHLIGLGGVSGEPVGQRLAMRSAETARSISTLALLAEAPAELAALARVSGDGHAIVLTGDAATEAALRSIVVPTGAILAFATHGLVADELEGLAEPALLLTPQGEDDGLLMPSEIGRLSLPAGLVILSACNTAAGSGEDAPRLSGLVQGFFLAGAHGVLASHWRVRDDAARRLTVATVAALNRGSSGQSGLREAVDTVRRGKDGEPALTHPALWAPFELFMRQ
jgi:CHAT domain-containing protein/tetratricopeptide (TPR) repeat protein